MGSFLFPAVVLTDSDFLFFFRFSLLFLSLLSLWWRHALVISRPGFFFPFTTSNSQTISRQNIKIPAPEFNVHTDRGVLFASCQLHNIFAALNWKKKKIFLFDNWIYSERKKCGYYCRVNDCVCLFGADKFRFSTKKSYSPFRWWIREREREEWERKKQGGWKWGIGYHVSGRTKKKWRKRWRERKKNSNFISFGNSKPSRFTIVVGMK